MYTDLHNDNYPNPKFSIILCESCFDVLLEDDAEYLNGRAFCHRCIEEEAK
jgi:formylmethanofuran dehydrogenase subunit E